MQRDRAVVGMGRYRMPLAIYPKRRRVISLSRPPFKMVRAWSGSACHTRTVSLYHSVRTTRFHGHQCVCNSILKMALDAPIANIYMAAAH